MQHLHIHTNRLVPVPSPSGPNWPSLLSTALLFSTSDEKNVVCVYIYIYVCVSVSVCVCAVKLLSDT